jgi:ATP-binding cassette subfamily E protein 1
MSGQAGLLKPDTVEGTDIEIPEFNVSYKPQKISPKFQNTVRHLLHQKIRDSYMHPQFVSDVMKPLQIEQLMDQEVINLSGGELQRVAICLCLGKVILLFLLIRSVALFAFFFLIGHRMSGDNKCSMFK